MSIMKMFTTAASALDAQSVRLNLVASNLANAQTVSGSAETAYRAKYPVFAEVLEQATGTPESKGVRVASIVEGDDEPQRRYEPQHPLADAEGYIYGSNVNAIEEMANMMSASRSYQNNVEVMNTSKELALRTLSMGR